MGGELGLERRGVTVPRSFIIYTDRLEYWKDAASRPEGRVMAASIKDVDVLEDGFMILTNDVELRLHARADTNLSQWTKALGDLVGENAEENLAPPQFPSAVVREFADAEATATAVAKAAAEAAEARLRGSVDEGELPPPKALAAIIGDDAICRGHLSFEHDGIIEAAYAS